MIVLLIEDNADDALIIEVELESQAGSDVRLVRVSTLAQGLQRLAEGGVDVVLTDLGLPDSQGLDTFRRIHTEVPNVPIVVLTGNTDESVGLAAVGEGAQEFVCKSELRSGLLMRTIRFAIQRFVAAQKSATAKSVAMKLGFIGSKGGVGTSTVALNAALTLAASGKNVVLVELRSFFGSLAFRTKLNPTVNLGTLTGGEEGIKTADQFAKKLRQTPLAKHPSGLQILFAPQRAEQYRELEPDYVDCLLECLSNSADFVVLDLAPYPSPANRAALARCDRIVLVMEREVTCVQAGKAFLGLLELWGEMPAVTGIVVVNRALSGAPLDVNEASRQLSLPIIGMVPPAVDACDEAIRTGRPLVISFPQHLASDSLRELTRRLVSPGAMHPSV